MKKSTLNAIMYGVIIVLVIAISVVIIKIQTRPEEVIAELPTEELSETESIVEEISEEEPEIIVEERVRMIEDNVNVRSGPGTDYERLGSAYSGYDFELIEQRDDGWTQIIYDNREAYVYSEYVEIIPMILDENGEYTEYVNLDGESLEDNSSNNEESSETDVSDEASDTSEEE